MSFQAYLEAVHAKTGKTPADFALEVQRNGLSKHGEIVTWLKTEYELGHGHATAVTAALLKPGTRSGTIEQKLDRLCTKRKARWRDTCTQLIAVVSEFGSDVRAAPNETYVNVLAGTKKFAILQPSSAERFDVGIKLKGTPASGRLENAGSWNPMVTHRVRITAEPQADEELIGWLKQAYDLARTSAR